MEFPSDKEELNLKFPSDKEQTTSPIPVTPASKYFEVDNNLSTTDICLLHQQLYDSECEWCFEDQRTLQLYDTAGKENWMTNWPMNDSEILGGKITIMAGKEVCRLAWCEVLPTSEKTVSSLLQQIANGQVSL